MKPRRTVLLILLIFAAVLIWLLSGDRPLALLARWRKATDHTDRHSLDEMDTIPFSEGGAK